MENNSNELFANDLQVLKDAAWYYPEPLEKAKHIKDFVAFCKSDAVCCLNLLGHEIANVRVDKSKVEISTE